jgi:hypothetical protein
MILGIFPLRLLTDVLIREHQANQSISNHMLKYTGARDSIVVETLCYKPEGRGFDSSWDYYYYYYYYYLFFYSLPNPSSRTKP